MTADHKSGPESGEPTPGHSEPGISEPAISEPADPRDDKSEQASEYEAILSGRAGRLTGRKSPIRTPRRGERRRADRLALPKVPANVLRARVLSGEFPAGERITELTIIEQLQLTRTEVRAGLAVLAHEGWMRPIRNIGWEVVPIADDRLDELTSLRVALEVLAVQRCAFHAKQFGTERMEAAFAYLALTCRNRDRFSANTAEAELHRSFIAGSRHALLQKQWTLIDRDVQLLISTATARIPNNFDSGPAEPDGALLHVQLIDAITSGDAASAATLVQQQIEDRSRHLKWSAHQATAQTN